MCRIMETGESQKFYISLNVLCNRVYNRFNRKNKNLIYRFIMVTTVEF